MAGAGVRRKYGNVRVGSFDSKREKKRYADLLLLQRAGEISGLERQVRYQLIPAQYENGKCVERAVFYTCDAQYRDKSGALVVEDVKSPASKTRAYVIRRKLLRHVHGIAILEIS